VPVTAVQAGGRGDRAGHAGTGPRGPAGPSTEQRILDAAEACMDRHGVSRVSMQDVARQAGLSRGAVYLHFADRAALVDAALARTASRFLAEIEQRVRRRRTLSGQLAEAAARIREIHDDRLLAPGLRPEADTLLAMLLTARIHRLLEEWVQFWQPLLAAAQDRGEVRATLDRRRAGEWIVRVLLTFAIVPVVTFDAGDPGAVERFVRDHLVPGLAP
jgi:AcrR family transcriptional regulator